MPPRVPITKRVRDGRGAVVELRATSRAVVESAAWWQRIMAVGMLPAASMIFWWYPLNWALERTVPHAAAVRIAVVLALGSMAWGLAGLFMLCWLTLPWTANRRIAAWRVRFGHCGACAYPLKDLGRAADGCTVCPECGAAWRLKGADAAR